jgi:hypothetical protein
LFIYNVGCNFNFCSLSIFDVRKAFKRVRCSLYGIGKNVHKILVLQYCRDCKPEIFGVLGTGITFILAFLGQCHFYGLKELCPGVPQNSVWNTKCPEFPQVIKI